MLTRELARFGRNYLQARQEGARHGREAIGQARRASRAWRSILQVDERLRSWHRRRAWPWLLADLAVAGAAIVAAWLAWGA